MKYYNNCLFLSVRIGQATCWWSAVAFPGTKFFATYELCVQHNALALKVNSFQEDAGATNKKITTHLCLDFFVVGFGSGRQGLHHSNRRSNQYWTRRKHMNVRMTGRSHGEDWCFLFFSPWVLTAFDFLTPFQHHLNKWIELYFWIMVLRLFHVCFFGAGSSCSVALWAFHLE